MMRFLLALRLLRRRKSSFSFLDLLIQEFQLLFHYPLVLPLLLLQPIALFENFVHIVLYLLIFLCVLRFLEESLLACLSPSIEEHRVSLRDHFRGERTCVSFDWACILLMERSNEFMLVHLLLLGFDLVA